MTFESIQKEGEPPSVIKHTQASAQCNWPLWTSVCYCNSKKHMISSLLVRFMDITGLVVFKYKYADSDLFVLISKGDRTRKSSACFSYYGI